jgi:hypothetical protein
MWSQTIIRIPILLVISTAFVFGMAALSKCCCGGERKRRRETKRQDIRKLSPAWWLRGHISSMNRARLICRFVRLLISSHRWPILRLGRFFPIFGLAEPKNSGNIEGTYVYTCLILCMNRRTIPCTICIQTVSGFDSLSDQLQPLENTFSWKLNC